MREYVQENVVRAQDEAHVQAFFCEACLPGDVQ